MPTAKFSPETKTYQKKPLYADRVLYVSSPALTLVDYASVPLDVLDIG